MNHFNVITINRHRMHTDGVGVTSLVALSGCPLSCTYCINQDILPKNAKEYSVRELWDELSIDYCYFIGTGGGVTFGGGESLLYANAIDEFGYYMPEGVKINVETSLNVRLGRDIFDKLLKSVNEWIIDIKSLDADIYRKYTGINNQYVISNLNYIKDKGLQDRCHIRIPIIPKYTTQEDAKKDSKFINDMGFTNIEIFEYVMRDYMKNV